MATNAQRLAKAVLDRRAELDVTQLDVWQTGGPSNSTLTTIEKGELPSLTRTTARKLDVGLQWEAGSARRVWEGGDPTPALPSATKGITSKNSAWVRRQIGDADLDDNLRERLLEVLDEGRSG